MGIQPVREVTLIRHAYVRTAIRGRGIGSALLQHLRTLTARPILIGTWAAATWAIPERQIETSVVLAARRGHPI